MSRETAFDHVVTRSENDGALSAPSLWRDQAIPEPLRNSFPSENALRLVIRNRDEFSNFWRRLTARVPPGGWVPPLPEIDFSKEIVVVAAMGARPSSGYWTIIDGACEVDGQVEVFVSNVEDASCSGRFGIVTYPADAVRLPQTDLPIVFRETQVGCTQWQDQLLRLSRGTE